jgi:hypothetical protein
LRVLAKIRDELDGRDDAERVNVPFESARVVRPLEVLDPASKAAQIDQHDFMPVRSGSGQMIMLSRGKARKLESSKA